MFYTGSQFYVAGSNTDGRYSCYYLVQKNGSYSLANLDSKQTGGTARANDICVLDGTRYAVGYRRTSGGFYDGLIWTNFVMANYTSLYSKPLNPKAIFSHDNTLYIAGDGTSTAACYWEREIGDTVFSTTELHENGSTSAIFVK